MAKPTKPKPPEKIKVDPQDATFDLHTRGVVEITVNHPDGHLVPLTLHPLQRDRVPLRYLDILSRVMKEGPGQMGAMAELLKITLSEEEYELLLDSASLEDIQDIIPALFGADPS